MHPIDNCGLVMTITSQHLLSWRSDYFSDSALSKIYGQQSKFSIADAEAKKEPASSIEHTAHQPFGQEQFQFEVSTAK